MNPPPLLYVDILFLTTAVLYGAASILFIAYLGGSERVVSAGRIAPRLVGVAAVLHTVHLVVASMVYRVCPVEGVHFSMSVVSVLTCAAYLAMRVRYRIDVVGAFVAPFALTFFLASRFVGMGSIGDEPSSRMTRAILPIHVTVNVVGEALFMLSFAAAVGYLVQEKQLKKKRTGGIFQKLPALDALDRAEHRFLLAGFPFLTLGILTGTTWARRVEAGSPAEIARAVFAYASWLLFAGVLLLRAAAGWRGRRAAYGTIAGFGFAMLLLIFYLFRTATGGANMTAGIP